MSSKAYKDIYNIYIYLSTHLILVDASSEVFSLSFFHTFFPFSTNLLYICRGCCCCCCCSNRRRRLIWHRPDPFRNRALSPRSVSEFLYSLFLAVDTYFSHRYVFVCVHKPRKYFKREKKKKKKMAIFVIILFYAPQNWKYCVSFFFILLSLCPIHPSNPRELDHIVECFLILRLLLQQPSPSQVYVYFSYLMISKECSQSGDCYSMTLQRE